ncbi:hypothetical protein PENTCL1PPCAC_23310, partial [Pristionchus entomophagus]
ELSNLVMMSLSAIDIYLFLIKSASLLPVVFFLISHIEIDEYFLSPESQRTLTDIHFVLFWLRLSTLDNAPILHRSVLRSYHPLSDPSPIPHCRMPWE